MSTILTYTGATNDLTRPDDLGHDPDLDIAHSLAMQCRFIGHIRGHKSYSVAEHSVRVSWLLPESYRLWGLLHDAAETWYGDMSRPLKHMPGMRRYRGLEKRRLEAVAKHYGLVWPMPEAVKDADKRMYEFENAVLKHGRVPVNEAAFVRDLVPVAYERAFAGPLCWSPREAEQVFVGELRVLKSEWGWGWERYFNGPGEILTRRDFAATL